MRSISIAATIFLASQSIHAFANSNSGPAASVHPLIGTGGDPDDGINLFPGAVTPFGMVQLSPDTEDHGVGYHHIHTRIKGFSMTHMSGPGCSNEGDVFFTATSGSVLTSAADFQSPFSHTREDASPGYYQVDLLEWGIKAELSATDRTGVARFTFPADKPANILVPISRTLNNTNAASVRVVGDSSIAGFVENHAFCTNKQTYRAYFTMTFDRPFSSFGTWTGDTYGGPGKIAKASRSAEGSGPQEWAGAYASWAATPAAQSITAKIAISYVDEAGAAANLHSEAESKDFSAIRDAAQTAWNRELSTIEIQGGSQTQRTIFYTALYHSLLMPSLFDDADGRYLGFDCKTHTVATGHHIYANFSGWDIYRSEIPLLALIEPQRMQDMAQSIVLMYQQGGWIDRWPQINLYTNDMIGSPLSIALAITWLDGLHGFDIDSAWEGMLKDATQAPPVGKPYHGEDGVEWVNKVHYVPDDKVEYGSVAKTLEYAIAYASLSRLASSLGKTSDAAMLHERALIDRNVFDANSKFFRPRNADGSWVKDFDPAQDGHGFLEGTGWHYQSFAPADMAWLIKSVGQDAFNERMTAFFDYSLPGWYAQRFNPYNETDMQAPYVFNFSGQPWKSQRAVRQMLMDTYRDAPDGVPGNDDAGAMSSWAVLSMLGIYSVDPASLAYELVAPSFPSAVIHLQAPYAGKQFVITAQGASVNTQYIQSVQLNGKQYEKNWIPFSTIAAEGKLAEVVGKAPNYSWGTKPEDAPPSLGEVQ